MNDCDVIGVLNVYLGDKKIHEEKIYIKENNKTNRKNFVHKIKDWFKW